MKQILRLFKQAANAWRHDHASYLAAGISYNAIFSLAPLLLVVFAIVGVLYRRSDTEHQFFTLMEHFIGRDAATLIQGAITHSAAFTDKSGLAFAIGIVLVLLGSMGVFKRLQEAVNMIWHVPPPPRSWRLLVKRQASLFLLVLCTSALMILSLGTSALLTWGGSLLAGIIGSSPLLLAILHLLVSFGLLTLLFGLLLKLLPEAHPTWRSVWLAAIVTAALFSIGRYLIGVYIAHSSVGSAYGAAGSLVVLLIWIFYAAQIFLFGVELVKAKNSEGVQTEPASLLATPASVEKVGWGRAVAMVSMGVLLSFASSLKKK